MTLILDTRHLGCPLPVIRTMNMLRRMASGQGLEVIASDPGTIRDIEMLCRKTGDLLLSTRHTNGEFTFVIQKALNSIHLKSGGPSMADFPDHTLDTAPPDARPALEAARQSYGMIPNMFAKMAEAPPLLKSYLEVTRLFEQSGLDTAEQQVVLLTTSFTNRCKYCMGAHSVLADIQGVPESVTNAIRNGEEIADSRLEALHRFTARVVEERGWVSDADVKDFLEAGYTPANLLEVILGVGLKTMSNYTNHIVGTELDQAFSERAWAAPR